VSANQAVYPIRSVSRVLGVSPSGFYAWRKRLPSKREQADDMLTQEIKKIHQKSKGTYGAPRIHAELAEQGLHVGRKRVARLMRAADLRGVSRRKAPRTTQRQAGATPAPDLVQRNFTASRPNELWVADITYIPTWAGFLYLAVVLDAWSRRVVGWAMATHLRTELVLQALQMAIRQRCQARGEMSRNHRFKMSTFQRQSCPVGFVKLLVAPPFPRSPWTVPADPLCVSP
jgi:putative transposase